ncbi:UvrB/UvrC motif-containing protein [Candidatus Sumerlaeota bacterium]|nr:UvrB/UvrC motif-containing protein [Candidatus Sumerlaeota bacterium]
MRCKKNVATVKLTRIINGKVTELNLCSECAAEVSPYQKKLNETKANLAEILQKLIGGTAAKKTEPTEGMEKVKEDVRCQYCGLSLETYKNSLFLGCSGCYESFDKQVVSDLRRLHGSTQHVGKVPPRFRERIDRQRRINQIQRELERAIEEENFEKAALLRDQIRSLQEQMNNNV